MGVPTNDEKTYPDSVVNSLLNEDEFLAAVEATVSLASSENPTIETRDIAIMFHLGVLCYIQGVQLAVNRYTKDGLINSKSVSPIQRQITAILYAQTRWEFAETYCRTMLNIDINPIGLLVVLKRIAEDGPNDDILDKAVDAAARIIEERAENEVAEIGKIETPEITIDTEHESGFVPELFKLLDKLGTFHVDRRKYETHEQQKLHDKILEIYRRMTKTK